jgi:2-polyprenyl-3-methyl-5-hydroxy-6-metoxy-1,4-benzoquinol methylase
MRADYAQAYRALYRNHWWWRAREDFLVETLRRRLVRSTGNRILDIGCGSGLFFDRLAEFGEVSGIEVDATMKTGDPTVDDRIFWGPLEDFAPSTTYSLVLLLDVLEHLSDPLPTLRRAISLLSAGGILLATVPAFRVLWTRHDELNEHRTRYTKRTFRALLEEGNCRVETLRYFFAWTFPAKLTVRAVEGLSHAKAGLSGLPKVPPRPINRALYWLSRLEQACLRGAAPVGSSLLAVGSGTLRRSEHVDRL